MTLRLAALRHATAVACHVPGTWLEVKCDRGLCRHFRASPMPGEQPAVLLRQILDRAVDHAAATAGLHALLSAEPRKVAVRDDPPLTVRIGPDRWRRTCLGHTRDLFVVDRGSGVLDAVGRSLEAVERGASRYLWHRRDDALNATILVWEWPQLEPAEVLEGYEHALRASIRATCPRNRFRNGTAVASSH